MYACVCACVRACGVCVCIVQMYSDAIAQCSYSAFICAYPNSWNNFDNAFKSELCLCISLWQVGTWPMPGLWRKWPLALLELPNLLKVIGQDKHHEETSAKRAQTSADFRTPNKFFEQQKRKGKVFPQEQVFSTSTPSLHGSFSFNDVDKSLMVSKETLVSLVHPYNEGDNQAPEQSVVPSAAEAMDVGMKSRPDVIELVEVRVLNTFGDVYPNKPSSMSKTSLHQGSVLSNVKIVPGGLSAVASSCCKQHQEAVSTIPSIRVQTQTNKNMVS